MGPCINITLGQQCAAAIPRKLLTCLEHLLLRGPSSTGRAPTALKPIVGATLLGIASHSCPTRQRQCSFVWLLVYSAERHFPPRRRAKRFIWSSHKGRSRLTVLIPTPSLSDSFPKLQPSPHPLMMPSMISHLLSKSVMTSAINALTDKPPQFKLHWLLTRF